MFLSSITFGTVACLYLGTVHVSGAGNVQSSKTDATLIDLGTVWACNDSPVTIPVMNNATTELEIVDFHPSCSCTRIFPERLTIPGGKSRSFQVWIDLASYRPEQYQVPTRTTEIGIQAETSESLKEGISWTLRATVRNAIGLPPFVMIDRPVVIGGDPPSQSVQIVEHVPLQRIEVSCDPERALVAVESVLGEERLSTLSIHLKSCETQGAFEFPVLLTPVAEQQGAAIPPVTIRVQGRAVEDVHASPSGLAAGMLREGQRVEGNILLTSRQNRPFEIEKIIPSAPSFQVSVVGSNPLGESKRIHITSDPLPMGEISASVNVFAVDKATEWPMQIVVPVTGYVLPAEERDEAEAVGPPTSKVAEGRKVGK